MPTAEGQGGCDGSCDVAVAPDPSLRGHRVRRQLGHPYGAPLPPRRFQKAARRGQRHGRLPEVRRRHRVRRLRPRTLAEHDLVRQGLDHHLENQHRRSHLRALERWSLRLALAEIDSGAVLRQMRLEIYDGGKFTVHSGDQRPLRKDATVRMRTGFPGIGIVLLALFGGSSSATLSGQSIREAPVPTAGSGLGGITAGPDGALRFTQFVGNKIGRITSVGDAPVLTISKSAPASVVSGQNLTYTLT